MTIYGALSLFTSIDATKPSLFFIDGMPVVGNTSGLEEVGNYVLVEANGQFVTENGNRKFIVDSWSRDVDLGFYSGTLRNENGQILFTLDDGSGLLEKTHRGMYGKALGGYSAGGRTYGYKRVPIESPTKLDIDGRPEIVAEKRSINEDEAKWVRQIFEWFANGHSPKQTCG